MARATREAYPAVGEIPMVAVTRTVEIEHKFVVGSAYDYPALAARMEGLGPVRHIALEVSDRYFLTADGQARRYILRHRFDEELHHLTLKSFGDDPEVRAEINLDLGHHAGDQAATVEAFVAHMGLVWSGTLTKTIRVWVFPDCEVVHYIARGGGREVHCVEFEATDTEDRAEALEVLTRYEHLAGFDAAQRTHETLVDLVFPGVLPR